MRTIGILGGMMDPIHRGHIGAALAALDAGADTVLLAPCQSPAHRPRPVADAADRLEMCRLAAAADPRLQASDIELREGICYAADTVRLLAGQYPGAQVCWILGADKLPGLERWHEAQSLFAICDFYVCPRPGFDVFLSVPGARLHVLDAPAADLSSGQAIRAVTALQDAGDFLTPEVSRYIARQGLYQPDYISVLKRYGMGEKRLQHTLGVRRTAVDLAFRYGARMQAVSVAATLHDMAKPLPPGRMRALALEYGLKEPEEILSDGNLLHGPLAAVLAEKELGITDAEVLSAISCHTTGKAGMGLMDKILFIADAIEPNRPDYPGLHEIRALAEKDLDAAVLLSMHRTRDYVTERGLHFCSRTDTAMRDLEQKRRKERA